jgi:hypothetical protein
MQVLRETDAASGAGTAYPSGAPEFTYGLKVPGKTSKNFHK